MNIMVFDVPAESGGALSVLNDFYNEVKSSEEKNINWFFVISTPTLQETNNIKVLRFPWIKKSRVHRLYFDYFVANKLIKKHKIDKVFSLQNITIPFTNIHQTLYVHNALPFVEYKYSFKENRALWIYQNLIGKGIIKSIARADKTIAQTKWMKEAFIEKTGINEEKIVVIQPRINIPDIKYFNADKRSLSTFFYPASGVNFKNHKVIVEACRMLRERNSMDFKILFTLHGDESEEINELYNEVKMNDLPIEFVGFLTREQVFNIYSKSVMLFPSFIESFPLPLLEAKLHHGVILASNCPFSHDILGDYENAYFFNPFEPDSLAETMEKVISGQIKYEKKCKYNELNESSGKNILETILEN